MSEHQPQRQQADGTWAPAEPIPYTDGIDWEVYGKGRERRAIAYWHDKEVATVSPGPLFRLRLELAHRRAKRAQATR
jgi:hypothetical protein